MAYDRRIDGMHPEPVLPPTGIEIVNRSANAPAVMQERLRGVRSDEIVDAAYAPATLDKPPAAVQGSDHAGHAQRLLHCGEIYNIPFRLNFHGFRNDVSKSVFKPRIVFKHKGARYLGLDYAFP